MSPAGEQLPTASIIAVAEFCTHQRAATLELFTTLGGWVTTTAPGAQQRLWATAGHRHATHAEWCRERSPTVPVVDLEAAVANQRQRFRADQPVGDDRQRWYHDVIVQLAAAVNNFASRLDADLDPASVRLARQLAYDYAELASLTATGAPRTT